MIDDITSRNTSESSMTEHASHFGKSNECYDGVVNDRHYP